MLRRFFTLLMIVFLIPSYALASSPLYHHRLAGVATGGSCLELKDGSLWEVAPKDAYKTINWEKDDIVVITLNTSWLASKPYWMTNFSKDSYVNVSLQKEPLRFGSSTNWIVSLDKNSGGIYLQNGTRWKASPQDLETIRTWSVNESVIFGYNDAYFASYSYLLINATCAKVIQIKPF